MHASFYLRNAFSISLNKPVQYALEFFNCAMCHARTNEGFPKKEVLSSATADLADTFRFGDWLCEDCAACFNENRLLTSNILVINDTAYKPMVAQASATEERPSWRDIIKQIPLGATTVAIVTSNTKQRLWINAPVSRFGESWQVFFSDGDIKRILTVNANHITECLRLIEDIYALGFSKQTIADTLLNFSQMKALETLGYDYILACESALQKWRNTDTFIFCLFIAQKEQQS